MKIKITKLGKNLSPIISPIDFFNKEVPVQKIDDNQYKIVFDQKQYSDYMNLLGSHLKDQDKFLMMMTTIQFTWGGTIYMNLDALKRYGYEFEII